MKNRYVGLTFGFDYIFHRDTGIPYCIEINGDNAGSAKAHTVESDPTRRIIIECRDRRKKGEGRAFFQHANANPLSVKTITEDKSQQNRFIPKENNPKQIYFKGNEEELLECIKEAGTRSVLKPAGGQSGYEVTILPADHRDAVIVSSIINKRFELARQQIMEELKINIAPGIVFQQYIPPKAADNDSNKTRHACLRHLVDYTFDTETREMRTIFSSWVQRVSKPDNSGFALVNICQGAEPIAASQKEIEAVTPISLQIATNIAQVLL